MDTGQTYMYTVVATGGTGALIYTWSTGTLTVTAGCTTTSTTCTVSDGSAFSGTVSVAITDHSMGTGAPTPPYPSSTSGTLTIVAPPSITTPLITPVSRDIGQTYTYTVAATGGTGSLVYTWTLPGQVTVSSGCGLADTSCTITAITATAPSAVTVSVTVTDHSAGTGNVYPMSSSSLTIYTDPVVSVPTPSPASVDLGQTVVFTTVASGGTTFYTTFTWSESTSQLGCVLTNSASISCTPTATGTYHVQVTVTDTNGYTSTAAVSGVITVYSALAAQTASPLVAAVMDQGQTLAISTPATGYGGTDAYAFSWAIALGASCPTAQTFPILTASFTYTPNGVSTTCSFTVTITDTGTSLAATPTQVVTETTAVITVNTQLTAQTASPSGPVVLDDNQQSITVSTPATGYGGTGPYSFSWAVAVGYTCPGFTSANTASFLYSPTGGSPPVSCEFKVTVTDNGVSPSTSPYPNTVSETTATVTVNTALVVMVPSYGHSGVDQNQAFTVTLTRPSGVSAGTAPYSWIVLYSTDGIHYSPMTSVSGCGGAGPMAATESCAIPNSALPTLTVGTLYLELQVTDSATTPNTQTSSVLALTVSSALSVGTPTATVNPVEVAQTVTFSVTVLGGAGSFSYTWNGLPAGCASADTATLVCTPTSTSVGALAVSVTVTDGNANTLTGGVLDVTVIPNSATYSEVTATSANTQMYALPGAEEFMVGASNVMVDSISVYLSGSGGSANVGIGSAVLVDHVLTAQTISPVPTAGWYTVYFPAVMLSGSTNYYLNVFGTSDVTWGFTSNPSSEVNALQDYYYVGGYPGGVLTHDNQTPNLYKIGVYFTQAYTVTFTESGLPSGTWSATLGPTTLSAEYSSSIVFTVPNGAYPFTIPTVLGFSAAPSSGSITVNGGSPGTTRITYTPVPTYAVTFTETGLASGSWSVTLGPTTLSAAVGSPIVFTVPDGTYPFQVIAVLGFAASPTSGLIGVSGGSPPSQPIAFSPVTPSFTVNPSSGPAGSTFVMTGSGYAGLTSYETSFSGVTVLAAISCTVGTALESGFFTTTYLGTFSCTIQVPFSGLGSTPGSYAVTGGAGILATQPFTVTAPTTMVYSEVLQTTVGDIQLYALPGAEEFTAGASTVTANYAEVYLAGAGTADVSIGTTLWGTDVVSNIPISVDGAGWYTVTFSAVLVANAHYYLNVHQASGSVLWGYTVSPTTALNELQDYYYVSDVLTQDNASPNLYVVGYQAVD